MRTRPLSAATRAGTLDRLAARPYDLLVIGGGITGAGIALDAAARGLAVALVERDDLAAGTSSRSSSLIHGGLRYLSTGMVGLVRESARERELLRRLAPHLVQPLPFVLFARRWESPLMGAALWAYDAMGSFRTVARTRRLTPDEVRACVPVPVNGGGGVAREFHDCRTDDARLVLQVARTAHRLGADIATRAEAVELLQAGGRVVGATVRDRLAGGALDVQARVTVSAAGVWADEVRGLAGALDPLLVPSKGTHLVFPADVAPLQAAAVIPSRGGDHRSVFLLPWDGRIVVGTTDEHYDGSLDAPSVTQADADYLCAAVNEGFGLRLGPADAVGAWAGLRPLVRPGGKLQGGSEALSRRHAILEEPPGLLTITGGKLTTYRRMAEDVVNRVARTLGRGGRRRSPTAGIRLGLHGPMGAAVTRTREACVAAGVDPQAAVGLVARHGDDAPAVAGRAGDTGEVGWLPGGAGYLAVEARWAVEQELALSAEDVLARRLRVARRDAAAGLDSAGEVSALLREVGGVPEDAAAASVEDYRRAVAAERGVVPLAAAPRLTAPDRTAP